MVAFKSEADAECKLPDVYTDASACICKRVRVVHVYERARKRMHESAAMCNVHECIRKRVCVR